MKGGITEIIPMVIAFFVTIILVFSTLTVSNGFEKRLEDSIQDLNRISQTRYYSDLFFYNYYPMSGAYSFHQTTFELGKIGGGKEFRKTGGGKQEIVWREKNLPNILSWIYRELQQESRNYFERKYVKDLSGLNCEVGKPGFHFTPFFNLKFKEDIKFLLYAESQVKTSCDFREGKVTYKGSQEEFQTLFNASDNRYLILVKETYDFFKELSNSWDAQVTPEKGYSSWVCGDVGYEQYQNARENGRDKVRSDILGTFNSVKSSYPDTAGFKIERGVVSGPNDNLGYSVETFKFAGEATDTVQTGSCCIFDDGSCETYYHRVRATVAPGKSEVSWIINDTKYRIPTEKGWKNLFLNVTKYTHSYS